MFARDGAHPGKVIQEMFAKAVIDYIKNNKKQDRTRYTAKTPILSKKTAKKTGKKG